MPTLPILAGIHTEMKHLAERQRVISQNIANSETAGFKSHEVEAPDFGQMLEGAGGMPHIGRPTVQITSGMAALGARQPRGGSRVVLDHDVSETKPDGNNVTLEDQLLKMGQIQADFAAVTNIYRKQMGLMRLALGKNGG